MTDSTNSPAEKAAQNAARSDSYDKNDELAQAYATIISAFDDLGRPGLLKTPQRAADAMRFLNRGYEQDLDVVVNNALFPSDNREMIVVQDIELYSLCEHHLLPFIGRAHVAYIPSGQVLGLSKVARIIDMFARRLQIQEQLTFQIADAIRSVTGSPDVGVIVEAQHMCMMMRGVEKQNSKMKSSSMLGAFEQNAATRSEFLDLLRR